MTHQDTPTSMTTPPQTLTPSMQTLPPAQPKDYMTASMLSLFLGYVGIDRFYLGYTGLGILKLMTFGGLGLWALIDQILIITGDMKSSNGVPMEGFERNKKTAWIITVVFIVVNFLLSLLSIVLQLLVELVD